jgi:hypothetical protein
MRINIHWGEFCGPVERTEINFPASEIQDKNYPAYNYCINLKGYVPFALLKNIHTNRWLVNQQIDSSISRQVIFYTKKIIDDFELKYES